MLRRIWRMLSSTPGLTATVVLTLALGIGTCTAMFGVVNAVLIAPLPYPDAGRLAAIYATTPRVQYGYVSYLNFLDWQHGAKSFAAMAIYRNNDYLLTGNGPGERVTGMLVSADFFRTLGVAPHLGRDFTTADDHLGAAPVVLLGAGLWKRRFGGAPDVIGRAVDLDGVPRTVVGVLPDGFRFYGNARDAYTPIGAWNDPSFRDRNVDESAHAVARLKTDVTMAGASAEMNELARTLAQMYPAANQGVGIKLVGLQRDWSGNVRPVLLVLLAAVGLVLLIACVNVANLLLARSAGRAREYAIRATLGATRWRLVRHLLGESFLLAALGGALGLALAYGARGALLALVPATSPGLAAAGWDWRVVGFGALVATVAALSAGVVPARQTRHLQARVVRSRNSLLAMLSAAEVAMAVVLLSGAGLMLQTLEALSRVDPGYDAAHAATFVLALPATPNTTSAETRARLRAFDAAVAKVPGVVAETVTLGSRPLIHDSSLPIWIEGRPKPANQNDMPQALFYLVGPGYARAMGLRLERGRWITADDNENTAPVIVIDDVFARTLFPGQDPLGQHVHITGFGVQATVVGVTAHVRQWGPQLDAPTAIEAEFFYPFVQMPEKLMPLAAGGAAVVVRTAGDPQAVIGPVRRAVNQVDPREIVYNAQTLEDLLQSALSARRALFIMLALFGAVALALAAIGIYGVVAYMTGRRTREIGIRMALGSGRRQVLGLITGDAVRIGAWGAGVGMAASLPLSWVLRSLVYGVSVGNPLTTVAIPLLMLAVAGAAGYLPACKAAEVDPLVALRGE